MRHFRRREDSHEATGLKVQGIRTFSEGPTLVFKTLSVWPSKLSWDTWTREHNNPYIALVSISRSNHISTLTSAGANSKDPRTLGPNLSLRMTRKMLLGGMRVPAKDSEDPGILARNTPRAMPTGRAPVGCFLRLCIFGSRTSLAVKHKGPKHKPLPTWCKRRAVSPAVRSDLSRCLSLTCLSNMSTISNDQKTGSGLK